MQKRILLAVTGGIAAYKSCELVRLLKKEGHEVTVALSKAASEFVSAQTFEALSGNPVLTENNGSMAHINATRAADLMLIAPASANTIAKLAHGFADNLITEMASARKCALVLAPAMNVEMWQKPANLRNIQQLHKDGIRVLMPASGEQACGEVGVGRMVEPADIVEVLPDVWTPKPLRGKRVLISAGATYEAIDPVRGITNISSGQMGVAIARACRRAGAKVSLVHGKMTAEIPFGMAHTEYAESAMDMRDAIFKQLDAGQDVFISVAAVADYRVKNRSIEKLKKGAYGMMPVVKFIENPDILQEVASFSAAPFCVGFAAESENVLANAREKRVKKGVPMMIANDIADAMGKETTKITIIDDEQETALPEMSKDKAAQMLVVKLAAALQTATLKKAAAPVKPAMAASAAATSTATAAHAQAHVHAQAMATQPAPVAQPAAPVHAQPAPVHNDAHDDVITVQDDEPAPAAAPVHQPEHKKIIPAAVYEDEDDGVIIIE